MTTHLPAPKEVKDVLEQLLGRDVHLEPAVPFAPGPFRPATYAVYVDDRLRMAALVVCDLRFSAHVAAGVDLFPVAVAVEVVEQGRLTEQLARALHDLLDVMSRVFDAPDADPLRLYAVHHVGETPPREVHARALTLGRRLDLWVGISGYGAGAVTVILC